jgi:hypothetical protein
MNETTAMLGSSGVGASVTAAPRIYTALNEKPGRLPPRELRDSVGPRISSVMLAAQSARQTVSAPEASDQCGAQREIPTERLLDQSK